MLTPKLLCIGGLQLNAWVVKQAVKSTPRAVPPKRCSPPNSSWLGNFEQIHSSLEILADWGTPFFYNILIFVINIENNEFKIDSTCLQLYNKLLFTIYDRCFWYIQHFNFRKRCSFSVPSWLEKEEQPSWLGKKGTPFCKMFMFKKYYFAVVYTC